jgi:GTP-binding protein
VEVKFNAEVLRRKSSQRELGPIKRSSHSVSHSPLAMSSLPPQTRYICRSCIHTHARRQSSVIAPDRQQRIFNAPNPRDTRRNNGVTWDVKKFRKVKVDEETVSKWHASKILVGKNVRTVEIGPIPPTRILPTYLDAPERERTRPAGRTRGGRTRIPGPKAAEYLKEGGPGDLVPSEPTATLGLAKKVDRYTNVPVRPTLSTPKHEKHIPKTPEHFNWYWETMPPVYNDTARADDFFVKNRNPVKLLRSAARFMEVPDSDVPEVAFVGRSNVGKSSLLNAVVDANVKDLVARTSATRGFTRTMNFYGVGPGNGIMLKKDADGRQKITGTGGLVIVDMPGYGDGSLASWGVEIMKYIQSRKQLRRVFVLLDTEHGIKDKDRSLLASLRLAGVSHQVILSKMDKLFIPKEGFANDKSGSKVKSKGSLAALRATMETMRPELNPPVGGGALGEILACSSATLVGKKRLGIDHVRYAVLKAVGLDRVAPKNLGKIKRDGMKERASKPEKMKQAEKKREAVQSLLKRL